ncbi:MAG: ChaN family lipoprotein [Hyphomicrobiaceae bacterium]
MERRHILRPLLLALLAMAIVTPQAKAADWRETPWLSFEADLWPTHHLAGLIWGNVEGRVIEPKELVAILSSRRLVLLGEFHDNPDHHRLQAWLIAQIKPNAVVLEMADVDQQPAIDNFLADGNWSPTALGAALEWETRGWPDWGTYQPIAEASKSVGAKIAAGNAPRAEVRAVAKEGIAALDPSSDLRPPLERALPSSLANALEADIALSHCDMLPEALLPTMALAQRLRDLTMARRLDDAAGADGRAVLVTGNGHVRRDRGVPYALVSQGLSADNLASLMFMEVDPEAGTASDLVPLDAAGMPVADYIWITPGVSRPDPCEEMAKQRSGGG